MEPDVKHTYTLIKTMGMCCGKMSERVLSLSFLQQNDMITPPSSVEKLESSPRLFEW